MKKKIYSYMALALEDDSKVEEVTAEVVTEESDDVESLESETETVAEGEEVIDEDDSVLTDEEKEEQEVLDAPIEYPDIGNLNVDKVTGVLKEEEEERRERAVAALEESDGLLVAVEAFTEMIRSTGFISPPTARLGARVLEDCKTRLGYANPYVGFAMEGLNEEGSLRAASIIALEDFRTVVRQIWEAIIKSIQKAIEWLKKAFKDFFFSAKKAKEATQAFTNGIMKQRGGKESAFAKLQTNTLVDYKHYVSLPLAFSLLTLDGKQPGEYEVERFDADFQSHGSYKPTYAQAYESILELTKTHSAYPKVFGGEFIDRIKELCVGIVEEKPINVPVEILNLVESFPPNSYKTREFSGKVAPHGKEYIVSSGYLGGFSVTNLLSHVQPNSLEEGLTLIGEWKSEIAGNKGSVNDGWLRFLTNEEVMNTGDVVLGIENELLAYDKTLDKLTYLQEDLKRIAVAASDVSPMLPAEYFDKNGPNAWRGTAINLVIGAMNSIVSNMNSSVFSYATHSLHSCTAWNMYLQAIYLKEKQMLKVS